MKLHFWGATDDVTGSMTFLEHEGEIIMIDAGLAQGTIKTEELNLLATPFDPKNIKAIVITHAHLDHSGFLPRLTRKGFRGEIYCTNPTAKLMQIILNDSAGLNEADFYDEKDVSLTMSFVMVKDWKKKFQIGNLELEFLPAGHILGASSVLIQSERKSILFSGDLGRQDDFLLPEVPSAPKADIVVMESTYGSKVRLGDYKKDLYSFLATVSTQSRVGIIASFAVARAQTLLTLIHDFFEEYPQYKVRVVADSPMMKEANMIYKRYAHLTKLPEALFETMSEIDTIDFQREWETLKRKHGPLIILSSSGMLTGGRIARHLANWQDDEKAILFLPGYQGKGTPGRAFLEGKRTILGPNEEHVHWKGEVWHSDAFSSHADQQELINWVSTNNIDSEIFLLHGEESSKQELQKKLNDKGMSKVQIPYRGGVYSC